MEIKTATYYSDRLMQRKENMGVTVSHPGGRPAREPSHIQKLQVKGYHPIGNSRYIEVELPDSDIGLPDRSFLLWPNYQTRTAFTRYHAAAEGVPPKTFHTVDLFV